MSSIQFDKVYAQVKHYDYLGTAIECPLFTSEPLQGLKNNMQKEPMNNEWCKEFDNAVKKVSCDKSSNECPEWHGVCPITVKSFIRKIRSEAKEEAREEVREWMESKKKLEDRTVRDSGNWDLAIGYNTAIDDLLAFLSSNTEKK